MRGTVKESWDMVYNSNEITSDLLGKGDCDCLCLQVMIRVRIFVS